MLTQDGLCLLPPRSCEAVQKMEHQKVKKNEQRRGCVWGVCVCVKGF